MTLLSIRLFGYPRLFLDGAPLKLERKKTLALISFLAAGERAGRGTSREAVATLLWPGCSTEQAAAYLRQALWDFNKTAGEGWVERGGALLALAGGERIWVDVRAFEDLLLQARSLDTFTACERSLREAVELYQDDFMAGFSLRDSPEFDNWQSLQTEALRLGLAQALERLSQGYADQAQFQEAIACARRWLSLDALNESAHRALMQYYSDGGQAGAALRQYEACQKVLKDELHVSPEAATTALYQQIKARQAAGEPQAALRASRTRPPVPAFLPRQGALFVGREAELAFLKEKLTGPDTRLLTLLGPGGCGKTRLAIEAAGQCAGFPYNLQFTHGIYFVGLAPVTGRDQILPAIAQALQFNFRLRAGQALSNAEACAQLSQFLAGKELLLVLDNLEHLLPEAGVLSDLLASAPGLRILATSRARLALPEERVMEVDGLPYPQHEDDAAALSYAAAQLFVRGAERVRSFRPTREDSRAIARICRLVEGMPLGIEMASAWVRLFSCEEIAGEIARGLDFLESSGMEGISGRHHTLRAVFEHSWALLGEIERDVLRRLAVFQGGFTREAALAVTGASLRSLAALVDQSLLRRVSSRRFDLHELLKQYAYEKLAQDEAALSETRSRCADFFVNCSLDAFERLKGAEQLSALAALRDEQQNLRVVWQWLVQNERFAALERLLPLILLLYDLNGADTSAREIEGLLTSLIERLRPALALDPQNDTVRGCLALSLAGLRRFILHLAQPEQLDEMRREALLLARQLPASPTKGYALVLVVFGWGVSMADEIPAVMGEALEVMQAAGDAFGEALAHTVKADTLTFGDIDLVEGNRAYHEAMKLFTRLGSEWGLGLCYFGLGGVAAREGRKQEAFDALRRSAEIYERTNNVHRAAISRAVLGDLALELGYKAEARLCFERNQAYFNEIGDKRAEAYFRQKLSELQSIS